MNYKYIALAADNTLVQGVMEAGSDTLVEERLGRDGLKAVSVRPHSEGGTLRGLLPRVSTVSRRELIIFSQQLSILLSAGTPLLSGLQLLRDQAKSGAFKGTIDLMIADLKGGVSLHASMEKFPQSFPAVYVCLVEAGERSGTLETMLLHLNTYLQREAAATQQIKKALTYPAIVAVVGVIVLGILLTVVLPTMAEMLSKLGTDLPLLTRVIIGLSDLIQAYKFPGLVTMALAALGSWWYFRRRAGRMQLGYLILSAPWLGRL
ncbi:MAG: putative pilin biosis protein, partial [Dehalococcoidia bacterium]|nr:putative pilin biosis protein [Dehalococcoidia bacterium]